MKVKTYMVLLPNQQREYIIGKDYEDARLYALHVWGDRIKGIIEIPRGC
jgi:hypothetical protein